MYYRERQVTQSLGCTWVLGNPGILRKGGGGGGGGGYMCLNPGIYTWVLGNPRILRQGEDQYLGICLGCTWNPCTILCYLGFHSILYERVLAFLDMSGRNAYIFITRGV